ncbi:MAG: hypothetical protein GEU98_08320 [Pseudonocardiaceae bacterium]|nr:hypothetical protein [Pseudonocardiaceae bacterium]
MTKIDSVRAVPVEVALDEPWDFGMGRYDVATCVLVEVGTDSGLVGYGEAIARKSPRTTATVVEDLLRPIAVGRPLTEAGQIWYESLETLRRWGHSRGFLLEALSGLDIALWDLRGRELRRPVAELLPGPAARSVPVYASSVYFKPTVRDAVALAESTIARGYDALKIKLGHPREHGGLNRDVRTVRAIREAVGPDVRLCTDANSAYTFADARRFVEQVADCDLLWLEEPFPADDLGAYRALAAVSPVPLAAGEAEFSVLGFRELIGTGAIAYAQPDIARCGGFTGALQIADYCFAHNVPICPHTGFSGGVNNLASLVLAGSVFELDMLEHMIIGNPLREMFTEPLPEPDGGLLELPTGAGLGRDVDAAWLAEHRAG